MKRVFVLGAVLIVLVMAIVASAQVEGRLIGSVVDPSGAAVPGATVSLVLEGGERAILTTTANSEGLFSFGSVRPGSYDLVIEAQGFRKQTVRGVKVDPAREA